MNEAAIRDDNKFSKYASRWRGNKCVQLNKMATIRRIGTQTGSKKRKGLKTGERWREYGEFGARMCAELSVCPKNEE